MHQKVILKICMGKRNAASFEGNGKSAFTRRNWIQVN